VNSRELLRSRGLSSAAGAGRQKLRDAGGEGVVLERRSIDLECGVMLVVLREPGCCEESGFDETGPTNVSEATTACAAKVSVNLPGSVRHWTR
jgi:hypothetical protein